ncbi:MAG: ABC transporter substrate-binding protein [Candidatus Rokubacteria bacterium]|nr:ABC transporter substrate-binding protein [Candidatus Rokubacteria bacterium]
MTTPSLRPPVTLWVILVAAVVLMFVEVALGSVAIAAAGAPTDQLREGVDRVFTVVRDQALAGEARAAERRAAIGKVAGEIFDFGDMARRALGTHWEARTPAEREQFVRLYTDLIQRVYLSKVDQRESAHQMTILGETIDGDDAIVKTSIPLSQGSQMPLEYRMHGTHNRWRVYDISIDGISLVANYRAQFNRVIHNESYEALVAKFTAKPFAR